MQPSTMRVFWIVSLLVASVWSAGEDGEGQRPGKEADGGDGNDEQERAQQDAALLNMAQVARRCHNTNVRAETVLEQTLRCYGFHAEAARLAQILAGTGTQTGAATSSAVATSATDPPPVGGYQGSWASSAGVPRVPGSSGAEQRPSGHGEAAGPAWLDGVFVTVEASTATWAPAASGSAQASGGTAQASTSAAATEASAASTKRRASRWDVGPASAAPCSERSTSDVGARLDTVSGSGAGSRGGSALVAADETKDVDSVGAVSEEVTVRSDAATESSLYERVPEEDDAQFRAQQEADKEQEDALDAVARATQVPLSRRVRIRQQGTEALQTLDLRIRTAARIGSDDAPCFFCRGCARMPRFLRCPCARPANNLRGHVVCLSCMQSFFDKHANGDLRCPRCREALERPENGDALVGTDDALEVLTGVPLDRLVDMDAGWRIAQQPSCDNIVSLDRLRKRFDELRPRAAAEEGPSVRNGRGATSVDEGSAPRASANGSMEEPRGTPMGPKTPKRSKVPKQPKASKEQKGSAEAIEENGSVSVRAASTSSRRSSAQRSVSSASVADVRRWAGVSFAIAEQLAQRAEALQRRELQQFWAARNMPSTSIPPALLDALLTEVVGAGAYVDLSDSADFDEASQDGDEWKATSDEAETAEAEPHGSEATDPEPEQEEPDEDEDDVPVRSASEEAAVQRPVPDAWLIAAESWHQARKGFDKGQNTVRRETGVACPCHDCQASKQARGRVWSVDWRGYVNHFGSYVFRWRISCPFRGCVAAPRTRTQFLQHLKRVHGEETGAGSTWAERHLGRYQSTVRGPTRTDPFFQESETFLLDEPLPPAQWNRYLASLERLGTTGVNGGGGRDVEGEANGGPDEDVLESEGTSRDGRSNAEDQAPTSGAEERASGSEPSGAEEQAAGAEEEPSGAEESGPSGAAADKADGLAARVAVAAATVRAIMAAKEKRRRNETAEGDEGSAGKKRKSEDDASDFDPDSDKEH